MAVEAPSPGQDPSRPDAAVAAEVARMRPSFDGVASFVGVVLYVACVSGVVSFLALISPIVGTLALVAGAAIDLKSRKQLGGLPHGSWSLLWGSAFFWTWVAWSWRLNEDIVVSHFLCGTAQAALVILLPPVVALLSGGVACAALLVVRYKPAWPIAVARFTNIACVAIAIVLVPFAVARTLTYPLAADFVAHQPILLTLDAAEQGDFRCSIELPPARRSAPGDAAPSNGSDAPVEPVFTNPASVYGPEQLCVADTPLGTAGRPHERLRRVCGPERCTAYLLTRPDQDLEPLLRRSGDVSFDRDAPLVVRDLKRETLVISEPGRGMQLGLSRRTGEAVDVSVRDVASRVAPPLVVTFAAIGALILALAGAVSIGVRHMRARSLLSAPEATVDADGWLMMNDAAGERPVRVEGVRPGPVLVLGVRRGEPYRGGGRAQVLTTSHDEVRAALRQHRRSVASMLAIALPAAVVPVVAAMLVGLIL